jgi:tetratricopeptide (TPR) repeat protein
MMLLLRPLFLAVAAASLGAADVAAQGKDAVKVRKSGRTTQNTDLLVVQDDVKGVRAKNGPATLVFAAADVVDVTYGRAPEAYRAARAKFDEGDFAAALEGFTAALRREEDLKAHPWLANYALWFSAKCEERTGGLERAAAAYERSAAKFPASRFAPEVLATLGSLLLELGRAAEAKTWFARLADLTAKESLAPRYALLAEIGSARAAADSAKLEEIATKAASTPAVAAAARLEAGLLAAAKGDAAKAERTFRAILAAEGVDERTFSGAAVALGDVLIGRKDFAEATLAYSRAYAPLLRPGDDALRNANVARALLHGARAAESRAAATAAGDPERSALGRRARRLLRLAKETYPETPSGAEAAKEIGPK